MKQRGKIQKAKGREGRDVRGLQGDRLSKACWAEIKVEEIGIREEIGTQSAGMGVEVAALMKVVRKINESLLEQAAFRKGCKTKTKDLPSRWRLSRTIRAQTQYTAPFYWEPQVTQLSQKGHNINASSGRNKKSTADPIYLYSNKQFYDG